MSKEPTKRTDDDDYDYGEPRSAKEAPAATGTSPEDVPSINEPPGSAVFPPGYGPGEGQPPPEQLPPLVLTDIDPDSVPAGSGTFVLTVTGEGFDSNTLIVFNDEEMATTFVSATQLTSDLTPISAVAEVVDVELQRGDDLSDVLTFEFTAAAGRRTSEKASKPAKKGAKRKSKR